MSEMDPCHKVAW